MESRQDDADGTIQELSTERANLTVSQTAGHRAWVTIEEDEAIHTFSWQAKTKGPAIRISAEDNHVGTLEIETWPGEPDRIKHLKAVDINIHLEKTGPRTYLLATQHYLDTGPNACQITIRCDQPDGLTLKQPKNPQ